MSGTRLYFIRHAEVETAYHRVFCGHLDVGLSDEGKRQAQALAQFLAQSPLDVVYASPLKRAQQTLEPWLGESQRSVRLAPELREVDFGAWTGLTWQEVEQQYQISVYEWLEALEKGSIARCETAAALRQRLEPWLRTVISEHAGQRVGILCHGGVIRMCLAVLLERPFASFSKVDIDYVSVTQVHCGNGSVELASLNQVPGKGSV